MTAGYAGLMAALAAVLGLLYLALKVIRRVQVGRTGSAGAEVPLKLVQRIPIGPRQGVGLLQAGDRLLVISIAESGARLLTELDGAGDSGLDHPSSESALGSPVTKSGTRNSNWLRNQFGSLLSRFEAKGAGLAAVPVMAGMSPVEGAEENVPAPHPASERLVWRGRPGRVRLGEQSPEAPGPEVKPEDSPAARSIIWKRRPGPMFQPGRKLGWVALVMLLPAASLLAFLPAAAHGLDRNSGDLGPDETLGIMSRAPETPATMANAANLTNVAGADSSSITPASIPGPAGLLVTPAFDAKLHPSANALGGGRIDAATLIARAKARVAGGGARGPGSSGAAPPAPGSSGVAAASFAPPLPGSAGSGGSLGPRLDLSIGNGKDDLHLSGAVGIVVFLGALTLLPALLLLMTSFTRILIVLQFLRPAIGTQSAPPVQLLVALSLLLTGVVMNPVLQQANREAIQPYMKHTITETEALNRGLAPFRGFMLRNINEKDLGMFVNLSGEGGHVNAPENVGTLTLASAFVTSELRTSFQMGFLIFIPFIIVDLIVASVLMSLGMFMLPPLMVSLPFKLLLFVLADGWSLVVKNLVLSFR